MSARTLAALVTMLLTVSMLLALAPAQAHSVSPSTPAATVRADAVQPAADIFPTILNGFGYTPVAFYPGVPGSGSLYFLVTDPLDLAVNVTITDPNAARDNVSIPAFHYEATLNPATSTFDSYTAGVGYTLPANLTYGGLWTVNFSAPNGGFVDVTVAVQLYSLVLTTSVPQDITLPGQPVSVFWSLHLETNGATLYTRATNVWITGRYVGNGTLQNVFPQGRLALTPAKAGQGAWSGFVPANATPNSEIQFEVYAITNASGQTAENESAYVNVGVGVLTIRSYGITPAPQICSFVNDQDFATGTLVLSCVLVGATYNGGFTPVSGLPVTVHYWNGTAHVTPSGAPTNLTTNASGEAAFSFLATSPPFTQEFRYALYDALNFSVTVPRASTLYQWTQWLNASWTLTGGSTASGVVQVSLDHTEYYQGVTATATWSLSSSNLSKTGAISAVGWIVTGPDGVTYQQGALNSSVSSGTFLFPITAAMVPNTIYVAVFAANATEEFDGYASAEVLSPSLLLTPASSYYTPGSTATVMAVLNGGGAGATIQYEAFGYWADERALLSTGTVANGSSIAVAITATTSPLSIAVDAWATLGGQVIASNDAGLILAQGYSIQLGVTTSSSYSDGSYQPGQSVTLSYQVVAVGGAALPQVVTFGLIAQGYPNLYMIRNVGPTGTISFTIPSNAVQGTLVLALEATGGINPSSCFPVGECAGIATLFINPNPSVLNLELGAGITVGWMILLVLVIVVAVVLFLVLRRGGGGRRAAMSVSTWSPPASAPAAEPATEWKEPAPTPAPEPEPSGSPPRLPEPPSGPSS